MDNVTPNTPEAKKTTSEMVISRQAQEVQAAIFISKKFPRDEKASMDRILGACSRHGLAEQAQYVYPRGGQKVSGPSIRLAESLAQNWGNIDYGIIELDNKGGQSNLMAYAWDLETNTRVTKVFHVKHQRTTKSGSYDLTDARDVYEATANFGARRVRACILSVIPGDVTEMAIDQCRKTISSNKSPLETRVKAMLDVFKTEYQVTHAQIEEYLGCNIRAITENELIRIKGVYRSLKDGMSAVADYFILPENTIKDVFQSKAPNSPVAESKDTLPQKDEKVEPEQISQGKVGVSKGESEDYLTKEENLGVSVETAWEREDKEKKDKK